MTNSNTLRVAVWQKRSGTPLTSVTQATTRTCGGCVHNATPHISELATVTRQKTEWAGTRASAKRLGCKTTVCKHRNCPPMCIFGKRMAAGFSFNRWKQDQPWRVGTAQELWVWWSINKSCMSMRRRMLWPHDLSSPATEGHDPTTHSGRHLCDPKWPFSDSVVVYEYRWISQKHVEVTFFLQIKIDKNKIWMQMAI